MFYANIISVDIKSAPKIRARMVVFFVVSFHIGATFKQLSYMRYICKHIPFDLNYCIVAAHLHGNKTHIHDTVKKPIDHFVYASDI